MTLPLFQDFKGAHIEGEFRFHLWRAWREGSRSAVFIMLNPSTADGETDDPTIRKCIGFAKRWKLGSIDVLNLYAYRATDPDELKKAGYPTGGHRAEGTIRAVLNGAYPKLVVYGWGTHAQWDRVREVDKMVRHAGFEPQALRINQDGSPGHPLYIGYDTELVPWSLPQLQPN